MSLRLVVPLVVAACLHAEAFGAGRDGPPPRPPNEAVANHAIREGLASGQPEARRPILREHLRSLYEPQYSPLWTFDGRPTALTFRAIGILRGAPVHGLREEDYGVAALESSFWGLLTAPVVEAHATATFDLSLSLSLLRYLFDVHQGRVNPRELRFDFAVAPGEHDFVGLIRESASPGPHRDLAAEVEPRFPQYRRLMSALSRYRSLAGDPDLARDGAAGSPGLAVARKVTDGDAYSDQEHLVRLLRAFGDLPMAETLPEGDVYTGSLVAAVKHFQARHGIEPDGVLGRETFRQLNRPLEHRIRQIEWALERQRWLPHIPAGRFLIVNVPAFRLVAFESWERPRPSLEMNVVVGRAARTRTPFFAGAMRHLMFRPYWYPPRSIIENEILPTLQRNERYFEENQMELVSENDEAPVPAGAEELAAGTVRLRQRPGEHNALGLLKFVLPNSYDVYLHDTPAPALFARPRRDFSHGCIRVERPLELAEFVLADPAWSHAEIERATRGDRTLRVELKVAVPVLVFYTTTIVRADGTVEFYDDIYDEDAKLEKRLARQRAPDGP